jgi:hypothetical protein
MTDAATITWWRRLRYTRLRDALRLRFDGRLDWRQLITSSGLPDSLADAARGVVRRTRLWRQERVDVARELVAHFQDGLDAGRTAEQLLESFGNSRSAAQLIRRAKKRGRPWWWQAARCLVWSLAALFLVYLVSGLYLAFGRPQIRTDYLAIVNERAFAVPDAERAWPLYRQAFQAMDIHAGLPYQSQEQLAKYTNIRPEDESWGDALRFLEQHKTAIGQLRAAGLRESLGLRAWSNIRSYAPEDRYVLTGRSPDDPLFQSRNNPEPSDSLLISTLLPHLRLARESSGLLATDCRRAAQAGDADTALADVLAILGISRHMQEQSFLVSALAASAVNGIAMELVQELLADYPDLWLNDQLRDLAHQIARNNVDWLRAFDGDRKAFYDIVQRVYTDDGRGDGRISQAGMKLIADIQRLPDGTHFPHTDWWTQRGPALALLPAANMMIASRKEMTDLYDRHMDLAEQQIQSPVWEWNEFDAKAVLQPLGHSQRLALRYVLVGLFAPAAEAVQKSAEWSRGIRDGVLIGIALELYRREHGQWPASLDELTPRWLPILPVDRITGRPLRYRLVDGQPMVYSVGVDRDDDHGRLAPRPAAQNAAPSSSFAGPRYWKQEAVIEPAHDGDWVIWTAAVSSEPIAGSGE